MIIRSYLPYKSAREYADRGMAKWMGFFISEHSTALATECDTIDFSYFMDDEDKIFFLSQVFLKNKKLLMYTSIRKKPYVGKILEINKDNIVFRENHKTFNFTYEEILKLTLAEVIENEQI